MNRTMVYYDNDTKVSTSGTTCTFYRINIRLDPKGKDALMLVREGKEQLRNALERIIDEGVERIMGD